MMPALLKLFKRRVVAFFGFSLLAFGTWLQGDLADRFRDAYARVTITDDHGRHAWSNPIWFVPK